MNYDQTINQLAANASVFKSLLTGLPREEYLWKSEPGKWCLLEIVCHLYDEEREDFRARTRLVLETPETALPLFDPVAWVLQRKYMEQDYSVKLSQFIKEREQSVEWLRSLKDPKWDNAYAHPKFGDMTAKMFLANWLAHDYMHMRQILYVKFQYLKKDSGETLTYAGDW
jgi:hypothetical protein